MPQSRPGRPQARALLPEALTRFDFGTARSSAPVLRSAPVKSPAREGRVFLGSTVSSIVFCNVDGERSERHSVGHPGRWGLEEEFRLNRHHRQLWTARPRLRGCEKGSEVRSWDHLTAVRAGFGSSLLRLLPACGVVLSPPQVNTGSGRIASPSLYCNCHNTIISDPGL
jgi:hypothetical protein